MEKMKKIISLVMLIWLFSSHSFALEKPTHRKINETVATLTLPSGFNLDTYLKMNLSFSSGIGEVLIDNKTVQRWLELGGQYEDEPFYTRSLNHFHNPINNSGLGTFESAILWAEDQGSFGSLFGGNYSWGAVRDYYYLGLTSSTKTDREKNLADTFRGLGQLMHLIEDMSVPAHTRNDGHVLYNYENWVLDIQAYELSKFNSFISGPVFYGGSITNISNLFDKDMYIGSNPDVAVGNLIGLSEYSNANFFSEDTTFKNFTFPSYSSVQIVDYEIPDPQGGASTVLRQYYKKMSNGETGYRLATVGFLKDYITRYIPDYRGNEKPALDGGVYEDYAKLLLPRAVGYSAGLLNYFFRGDIDMIPDDATGSGYVIVNNTDEDMDGIFELWYDDSNDTRRMTWSGSYSIGRKSSGNNKSANITFTPPTDAKESGKYMLVFTGRLGDEEDAVVGKIVKKWPRGGIIKGSTTAIGVMILYKQEIKNYLISVPQNEIIIKAAFDEGSIDIIRVLTQVYTNEQIIWQLYTFIYDQNTNLYKERNKEEVLSVDLLNPMTEIPFSFTKNNQYNSGSTTSESTCTYSGFVAESSIQYSFLRDFFVPQGQGIKFLKEGYNSLSLVNVKTESVCNGTYRYWSWDGKECTDTYYDFQKYIDGPYDGPNCNRTATFASNCKPDNYTDRTGYCSELQAFNIGYSTWSGCDGSSVSSGTLDFTVGVWLNTTLEYDNFLKRINNPKYSGGQAWSIGEDGPCTSFNHEAREIYTTVKGRVLSENQIATEIKITQYGPTIGSIISEVKTNIEPDGKNLETMRFLALRQTRGYSMLKFLENGLILSYTSFMSIPSDSPILLNKAGDGFKLLSESFSNRLVLQVGIKYNEEVKDFTALSNRGVYVSAPEEVMDLMVEY